ncbi:hypothetical protein FH972_025462 [Carpinus fangiana]|uniref:N-acetyltransferase domain-containing protein n=1 Tax=Carpinus fangiana TaxID=176857 RepID=A0A5N6L1H9_9ROSI|nr:hypothetical protein FH972_025462 [Carpinus fangiana]
MHIRPMLPTDITAVTDIGDAAFIDDEYFLFIHPHSHKYPISWRDHVYSRIRRRLHEPGLHCFVCVLDSRDTTLLASGNCAVGEVAGYGIWERLGPTTSPTAVAWRANNRTFCAWVERTLFAVQDKYEDLFRIHRSIDRANLARLMTSADGCDVFDKYLAEHWHMRVLAVHPRFQRQGVGQHLVTWGLDRARHEGVTATIDASENGSRLYRKLGFRSVGWLDLAVEQAWPGGQIMVYDPTGEHIRLAIGDERNFKVAGTTREVDAVWKKLDEKEALEKKEGDVDHVGDKGP